MAKAELIEEYGEENYKYFVAANNNQREQETKNEQLEQELIGELRQKAHSALYVLTENIQNIAKLRYEGLKLPSFKDHTKLTYDVIISEVKKLLYPNEE